MFLNTIYSERLEIKEGLKREILRILHQYRGEIAQPQIGPRNDGDRSMDIALSVSRRFVARLYHPDSYSKGLNYFKLTLLYQSADEVVQEQRVNDTGNDIMQRFLFVIAHIHCEHYADVIFPSQWREIVQRRLAVAMVLNPRLGGNSIMRRLEDSFIRSFSLHNFDEDGDLSNVGDYDVLIERWEDFFLGVGML